MEASPENFMVKIDLGTRQSVCATHGEFESKGIKLPRMTREIWSPCPSCSSDEEKAERRRLAEIKASAERERLDAMLRASGIPERVKGCTFANFNASTDAQKFAMQAAMDFAETFKDRAKGGDSLIFAGRPGTGKGHLAAAVMNRLMPEYLPVYTTCLDMIRSVRETWRKDSKHSESQVLDELESAWLLIIDEIGVQYGTDGEQTIIFDVLDRRYRQMRPTIFITNQDKAGFKAFIGERAYDRLTQVAKWVPFDWGSYRATARREAV
jgi:DNA replication protein DnaC